MIEAFATQRPRLISPVKIKLICGLAIGVGGGRSVSRLILSDPSSMYDAGEMLGCIAIVSTDIETITKAARVIDIFLIFIAGNASAFFGLPVEPRFTMFSARAT